MRQGTVGQKGMPREGEYIVEKLLGVPVTQVCVGKMVNGVKCRRCQVASAKVGDGEPPGDGLSNV